MLFNKFSTLTLFCLTLAVLNGCNAITMTKMESNDTNNSLESHDPDTVTEQQSVTETLPNSTDNILDLLDPQIKTEQQAFANAESELKAGKLDNALVYYMKTLRFNPKNIKALENVAAIHTFNQHPELAAAIYQNIINIDPRNSLANVNLGLYFLDHGQIPKAKERLMIAVSNDNTARQANTWKAHNGLGVIADLENNTTDAIIHYQAALTKEPSNAMLLNNLGYSYYLSGDENLAKTYFNKALANDNRYDRAIHNLALIEIKTGNFSTANAYFNRIMPAYESYNNIGYLCLLTGQYDVADEYLRRAINESPVYFPKAQENLKTLLKLNASPEGSYKSVLEPASVTPLSTKKMSIVNTKKPQISSLKPVSGKHSLAEKAPSKSALETTSVAPIKKKTPNLNTQKSQITPVKTVSVKPSLAEKKHLNK